MIAIGIGVFWRCDPVGAGCSFCGVANADGANADAQGARDLRLAYEAGLPSREVARRVGVGSTGVRMMLQRFRASDLNWSLPGELTDTALEMNVESYRRRAALQRQST